ncbi:antibiotic biosynthesis monooxygenase [Myxococcota bacterium]|nr:antibiotic biosynthesis monooxygenase [Myxococcota bacterium]
MILIAGTVDVNPEQRDAAIEAARLLMEETRSQAGCVDYVWCADPTNAARIYVYERWDDQESLAAHLNGPYYKAMLKTIGDHEVRGIDVSKFRCDLSEPVYDPEGKPRADFFTA